MMAMIRRPPALRSRRARNADGDRRRLFCQLWAVKKERGSADHAPFFMSGTKYFFKSDRFGVTLFFNPILQLSRDAVENRCGLGLGVKIDKGFTVVAGLHDGRIDGNFPQKRHMHGLGQFFPAA